MTIWIRGAARAIAVSVLLTGAAAAQGPARGGQGGTATSVEAVASPTYVTIALEIDVNRPAAEVWKRVGKYCDIGEWFPGLTCTITSGRDGEVGAVRSVASEVLVGRTELSYTYTQPVAAGRPYNLYHGTLEARPITATTSKLLYTLMYDNSMLADDAAREQDRQRRATTFTTALQNMKILAEGGTLPPQPARGRRGGAPGGAPAPAGRGN